jgi:replicative DNA helicase
VEARGVKDRRPRMSDLRESGSVEQDADNIVLVYREDYYNPKAENAGETELLIEKQRSGERGVVKVRFTDYCTRFDDLAEERWGAWQGGDE